MKSQQKKFPAAIFPQEKALLKKEIGRAFLLLKTTEDIFKNAIEQIPGVASVEITGGMKKEIQVQVETKKLLAYNLTLQDISSAIKREKLHSNTV